MSARRHHRPVTVTPVATGIELRIGGTATVLTPTAARRLADELHDGADLHDLIDTILTEGPR